MYFKIEQCFRVTTWRSVEQINNCICWFSYQRLETPFLIVETRSEYDLKISDITINLLRDFFPDAVTIDVLENKTFLELKSAGHLNLLTLLNNKLEPINTYKEQRKFLGWDR